MNVFSLRMTLDVTPELHFSEPPQPDGIELYWDDDKSWTETDRRSVLTCATQRSRPPATFRFIRDYSDITHLATYERGDVDSNGTVYVMSKKNSLIV